MASIQQTGRTRKPYRVRWRENGRPRSLSFVTLEEAEQHKLKVESRQSAAVSELKPNLPFDRYAAIWLIYQRVELENTASTVERARTEADYIIGPWAKRERWTVANVTPGQIKP